MPQNKRCDKNENWPPIKREIEEHFRKHGSRPRTICRSCTAKFGEDESPHNLLPNEKHRAMSDLTVYVNFRDERVARDNIWYIIAFPNARYDELPKHDNPRLGAPDIGKADVRKTPAIFKFRDLDDLKERYYNALG